MGGCTEVEHIQTGRDLTQPWAQSPRLLRRARDEPRPAEVADIIDSAGERDSGEYGAGFGAVDENLDEAVEFLVVAHVLPYSSNDIQPSDISTFQTPYGF